METGIDAQLLIRATAAAGLAKTAVDVVRAQANVYQWVPPVAAWVFSLLILVCLFEANGVHVDDRQSLFTVTFGAFIAAPMAMGATALQSSVERKQTERKVAEVQDAAQAQHEKTVDAIGPLLEQASRRGAQIVIDELRSRTAA